MSGLVYKIDGTESFGFFLWEYSPASIIKVGSKTVFLEHDTRLVLLFHDADCTRPVMINGKAQAKSINKSSLTFIKHIADVDVCTTVKEDA